MKMLDLFSGIGGFSLAASWAGIETVAFCEKDEYCQRVLKKHWPDVPIVSDIHDLRGDEYGPVDIVTGGFPCQPFSVAGKRKGKEDDRYLWPQMLRVIQTARPTWVLGENVPGIIGLALDQVLSDLEALGYATQTLIIPACAVDAPHRRNRVWIIAYRDNGRRRKLFQQKQFSGSSKAANIGGNGKIQSMANARSVKLQGVSNVFGNKIFSTRHIGKNVSNPKTPICKRERRTRAGRKGLTNGRWWPTEPNVGRVANGVPDRVDRIKGLGNAIVPQVVYQLLKTIVEIEESKWER